MPETDTKAAEEQSPDVDVEKKTTETTAIESTINKIKNVGPNPFKRVLGGISSYVTFVLMIVVCLIIFGIGMADGENITKRLSFVLILGSLIIIGGFAARST